MKFAVGVFAYLSVVASIIGLGTVMLVSSLDRPAGASPVAVRQEPQKLAAVERELPPKLQMKPDPVVEHKPVVVLNDAPRLRAEARKSAGLPVADARTSERKAAQRSRKVSSEARDAFASSSQGRAEARETPRPFVTEHRVY